MTGLTAQDYRRLVIKVGSSLLIDVHAGLNRPWLEALAMDIAERHRQGQQVLVVSSGAIALGSGVLGINVRRSRLEDLQAAAAAGQVQLAHAYNEVLGEHGIKTAQVLLTPEDTENRRRFLNARGTLERLLEHKVVPIINENDTVATEEIRYGDNDRLAARVAQMVMADGLLLLSDVDGFYSADPGAHKDAKHIPEVRVITDELQQMAGETRSDIGSGGMATKVQAARIATRAGCSTIIANGVVARPLQALANGARHTTFLASATPAAARKQWLAGSLNVGGSLTIDEGAIRALRDGRSLLPVGVTSVTGKFERGDIVSVTAKSGAELGRGLAEYGSDDANKLLGCRSEDIEERLGYRGRSVMLHRDEMVVFDQDE